MKQKKFIFTFTKDELVYISKKRFIDLEMKNKKFSEKQRVKNEMLKGERTITINRDSFDIDDLISVSYDDLIKVSYENKLLILKFITKVWICIPERAFDDINDIELLSEELSNIAESNVEKENLNPRYYDISDEIVIDSILEHSQYEWLTLMEKKLTKKGDIKRNSSKIRILIISYIFILTVINIVVSGYLYVKGDSLSFLPILIYGVGIFPLNVYSDLLGIIGVIKLEKRILESMLNIKLFLRRMN